MNDYIGSTRIKMAEYTRKARERYDQENSGLTVEEVKARNQRIEEQCNTTVSKGE